MRPTTRTRGNAMQTRRRFVLASTTLALTGSLRALAAGIAPAPPAFEIVHSDDEWRRMLTPTQFAVLRREGTERPYSSPLNSEHRTGIFSCAGCGLALFRRAPSSKAIPDGRASGRRSIMQSPRVRTALSASFAPKCIAAAAADIWATYSTMDPNPRACAIA